MQKHDYTCQHTIKRKENEGRGCANVSVLCVIRPVKQLSSEVVVGAQCGSAVLRGAHVFAPGILASPKCKCSISGVEVPDHYIIHIRFYFLSSPAPALCSHSQT